MLGFPYSPLSRRALPTFLPGPAGLGGGLRLVLVGRWCGAALQGLDVRPELVHVPGALLQAGILRPEIGGAALGGAPGLPLGLQPGGKDLNADVLLARALGKGGVFLPRPGKGSIPFLSVSAESTGYGCGLMPR